MGLTAPNSHYAWLAEQPFPKENRCRSTELASASRSTSDAERRQNIHADRRGCRKAFWARCRAEAGPVPVAAGSPITG
jgi:hypothetical protein